MVPSFRRLLPLTGVPDRPAPPRPSRNPPHAQSGAPPAPELPAGGSRGRRPDFAFALRPSALQPGRALRPLPISTRRRRPGTRRLQFRVNFQQGAAGRLNSLSCRWYQSRGRRDSMERKRGWVPYADGGVTVKSVPGPGEREGGRRDRGWPRWPACFRNVGWTREDVLRFRDPSVETAARGLVTVRLTDEQVYVTSVFHPELQTLPSPLPGTGPRGPRLDAIGHSPEHLPIRTCRVHCNLGTSVSSCALRPPPPVPRAPPG